MGGPFFGCGKKKKQRTGVVAGLQCKFGPTEMIIVVIIIIKLLL